MRGLLLAVMTLCLAVPAWAAPEVKNSNVSTSTFQDGRQPAADSEFFRDTYIAAAVADTGKNHGAADSMRVAGSANAATFKTGTNRILIDFDFAAALPDSAEIRRCRLCLYQLMGGTGTNTDTLEVTRLLRAWNEGTGTNDGTAQAANADWNNATGAAWAVAGADGQYLAARSFTWVSTDSTSAAPTFTGTDSLSSYQNLSVNDNIGIGQLGTAKTGAGAAAQRGWICLDVTQDARNVHSGAYGPAFHGWLIRMHNNPNNKVFAYATSEHPYKVIRPYMEIDFIDLTNGVGGGGGMIMGPGTIGVRQ